MSLGTRLKEIRKENRFSQEEMAEALHMSQANYNKYENDKMCATTDFIEKVAERFDKSVYWLMAGEGVRIENIKVDNGNSFVNTNNVYTVPKDLADSLMLQGKLLAEMMKVNTAILERIERKG